MLSVIVPAYNAASTIGLTLDLLVAQEPSPAELIVVDDASTDDTADVARAHGATIVTREHNGGPGAARNSGAGHATGDVIVFVDADNAPEPGFLAAIADAFEQGASFVLFTPEPFGSDSLAARLLERSWRTVPAWRPPWPGGMPDRSGNFAMRRDLYERLEGCDEDLRACEDFDLAIRASLTGHPPDRIEGARIRRRWRGSVTGMLRQQAHWTYWSVWMRDRFNGFPFALRRHDHLLRRSALALSETLPRARARDRTGVALAALEAAQLLAMAAGQRAAELLLRLQPRRRLTPVVPPTPDLAMAGGALPPGPAAILTGDATIVAAVARALRADRSIASAPSGLLPTTAEDWDATPALTALVARATSDGWSLPVDLATRRLEAEHQVAHGDAVVTLHAIDAWLSRCATWVLPAPGAAAAVARLHLPGVPTIELTDDMLDRAPHVFVDWLDGEIPLASPERVVTALRVARARPR